MLTHRFAIDFEAAGPDFKRHAPLSVGITYVPREPVSSRVYKKRQWTFYRELPPGNKLEYEKEASRIGMSHLECIKQFVGDPQYPEFQIREETFNPGAVLAHMNSVLTHTLTDVCSAAQHFVKSIARNAPLEAVFDTTLFDSPLAKLILGNTFGHLGLDLRSLYRGMTGQENARLSHLPVVDERTRVHHAGEDSVFLAMQAQHVLYECLKW